MRAWLIVGMIAWSACTPSSETEQADRPVASTPAPAPTYVGASTCSGCHPDQAERWRGSHHDLAMQEANAETVLGDFSDAVLRHSGVESRFITRDGRFFSHTDGPDGVLRDYEIAYTFGATPLQQYLVRLPGGRLQALGAAWDSRPADAGGQRWFHLYPDERIAHDDVLHWTASSQNWNSMCADCHSTRLRRGYRSDEDRFETTWEEIDVACEACHGPGSEHATLPAGGGSPLPRLLPLAGAGRWELAEDEAIAHRVGPPPASDVADVCAPCHSRRAILTSDAEPGDPFLDDYRPALLSSGLYHADGQILDEVYVWGSFRQSRMYAAGVTCSDCHDPHSLHTAAELDTVCAKCHRGAVFDSTQHHHHEKGGVRCVDCHMPARTYMGVDERRDHSFRVPRPDLSLAIGTPNACETCHADRDAAWAAAAVAAWGGSAASRPHYGAALDAGRRRLPGADDALAALARDTAQPDIVRASALEVIADPGRRSSLGAITGAARDASALVRLGAVAAAERLSPRERLEILLPLLGDPRRAVRIATASALASVPPRSWPPGVRASLAAPIAEYRAAQLANADRPESHVNLGLLHVQFGELDAAAVEYRKAIGLREQFVPAYVNLADLHRLRGREDEAERMLRKALEFAPDNAEVRHALGLTLVRRGQSEEALAQLERAAALAPEQPHFAYVYGVALHSSGQTERALAVLDEALRRHPGDRDLLLTLATVNRDSGDLVRARGYALRLAELNPDDAMARRLVSELGGG